MNINTKVVIAIIAYIAANIVIIGVFMASTKMVDSDETISETSIESTALSVTTTTETETEVVVTTEAETEATTEPETEAALFADYEIEALCKMVYGEAQTSPREQKRWVAIVALNHYDKHCNGGNTLYDIVTDTNQFNGYSASHPVTDEIYGIVAEVIADYPTKTNWVDYYYFNSAGDGINNVFR